MVREFDTDFFSECSEMFRAAARGSPSPMSGPVSSSTPQLTPRSFLSAIGYLPAAPLRASVTTGGRAHDDASLRHRQALLDLAARFVRAFQLPMRHAPGAHFFGGLIPATVAGRPLDGTAALPAGGIGVNQRQAFEGCVGEAAEHLSILEWPEDRITDGRIPTGTGSDSPRLHRADCGLRTAGGIELEWALAGIGLDASHPPDTIEWIEATSLADGQHVLFPADLCLRRATPAPGVGRPAQTNGCAAGPTLHHATLAALSEVIERDAVAMWWFGGRKAEVLPVHMLEALGIPEFMRRLRGRPRRESWFLMLPSDVNVPVVAAVSADPDGCAVIAGFAAGVDLGPTAMRAALEMCQMELAQELSLLKRKQSGEDALTPGDRRWIDRHEHLTCDVFPQLRPAETAIIPFAPRGPDPLDAVQERLSLAGFTAYRIELSRAALAIPVVRVLVPGMQSSSPDWVSGRLRAALGSARVTDPQSELAPI